MDQLGKIIQQQLSKPEQTKSEPITTSRSEDLEILVAVGQGLIPEFFIKPDQQSYYLDLFDYFRGIPSKLDLKKGLLICGGVGTGKTLSMKLFQRMTRTFGIVATRHIVRDFFNDKAPGTIIDKYGRESFFKSGTGMLEKSKPWTWCFEDLGLESVSVKNYGNEVNPMEEILLDRYDLALSVGMKTYITTNLDVPLIEQNYGTRVRDRFRETMNVIKLTGETLRK
jgi:hypothetical protein